MFHLSRTRIRPIIQWAIPTPPIHVGNNHFCLHFVGSLIYNNCLSSIPHLTENSSSFSTVAVPLLVFSSWKNSKSVPRAKTIEKKNPDEGKMVYLYITLNMNLKFPYMCCHWSFSLWFLILVSPNILLSKKIVSLTEVRWARVTFLTPLFLVRACDSVMKLKKTGDWFHLGNSSFTQM